MRSSVRHRRSQLALWLPVHRLTLSLFVLLGASCSNLLFSVDIAESPSVSEVPAETASSRDSRGGRYKARRRRTSPEGPAVSVENQGRLRDLEQLAAGSLEATAAAADILRQPENLTRVKESQSFIAAFGRLSLWQEAISLLELKHTGQERSRGDLVMTNEAMLACSHAGKWEAVLALLSSSRAPDRISYNLAMAACCNAGEWEKVLELLSDRSDARRRADFSTYNVTITACAQGRQWERGVESLNGMLKADLQPTWVLYNLGIVLSGEGSLWRTAIDYLKDMWSRVVMPDALTYSSVVSVCEKGGQWEEAVRLVQSMRKKGLPVRLQTLESAVRACKKARKEAFALEAFPEYARELKKQA